MIPLQVLQPQAIMDNHRGWGDKGTHQKDNKHIAKGQKELLTISPELKSATWVKLRPCVPRKKLFSGRFDLCLWGKCLWACVLGISSSSFASTCRLDGNISCYLFTNDSVVAPKPWDHNRLIHSFEEEMHLFYSLPICIGHHNTGVLIKGKYGLTSYMIPELLVICNQ